MTASAIAQDAPPESKPQTSAAAEAATTVAAKVLTAEQIPADVRAAVEPLFGRIENAERIRATVKMNVVTSIGEEVLGRNQGLFQVASQIPNLLALSAKFDSDAVRLISTGDSLFIELSGTEYVETDAPATLNAFVASMPLQLGPQPEPMLLLSVAGMKPADLLLNGLAEVAVTAGPVVEDAATKLVKARRPEGIQWELQFTEGADPRPLQLSIDITEMITRANNLEVPEGYSFKVMYTFERWDADGPLAAELFTFTPPEEAVRYESIAAYLEAKSASQEHPLLGKPAPTFTAPSLAADPVEFTGQSGDVIVLDFWATWCGPCVVALPEIAKLADELSDKKVRFYAISVSEEKEAVQNFIEEKGLEDLQVLLDPGGELASAFAASAIPQTVLIGQDGRVEAVHVGFDPDNSIKILRQEIETLLAGRRLHQAEEVESDAASEPEAAPASTAEKQKTDN